jgi:hypothetical protein
MAGCLWSSADLLAPFNSASRLFAGMVGDPPSLTLRARERNRCPINHDKRQIAQLQNSRFGLGILKQKRKQWRHELAQTPANGTPESVFFKLHVELQ